MKKLLSLILALMMMLSCISVFAEGESAGDSAGESATETTEAADEGGSQTISLSEEELAAELIRVNTPWTLL